MLVGGFRAVKLLDIGDRSRDWRMELRLGDRIERG